MEIAVAKIIALLALVGALTAGYFGWHHHVDKQGFDRAEKLYQDRERDTKAKADAVLFVANENVRKSQSEIQTIREQIIAKTQELENAKVERDHLIADYRAGVKRVSILGAACQSGTTKQNSGSTTATEPSQEQCELLPGTAATVLDIARRYRDDVQKLNECVDLYNAVRETVNTP